MKTKRRYTTRAAFGAAMKVSGATMTRLLARDDWPAAKSPPWAMKDVVKVQKWRESCLREDRAATEHAPADPSTKSLRQRKLEQEIRKLSAQAGCAEIELKREDGKLLDADEVEAGQVERIEAVMGAMREAVGILARKLAVAFGIDPAKSEPIIEAEFRAICSAFADGRTYADAPQTGD
jgi:hypothetical protein